MSDNGTGKTIDRDAALHAVMAALGYGRTVGMSALLSTYTDIDGTCVLYLGDDLGKGEAVALEAEACGLLARAQLLLDARDAAHEGDPGPKAPYVPHAMGAGEDDDALLGVLRTMADLLGDEDDEAAEVDVPGGVTAGNTEEVYRDQPVPPAE